MSSINLFDSEPVSEPADQLERLFGKPDMSRPAYFGRG
jgi:hypothetical protein